MEPDGRRSEGELSDFENPFHRNLPTCQREGRGELFERSTHWFDSIRVDLPEYSGSLQMDVFLDWLDQIECIFEYKEIPDNKRIKLVALKLSDRAFAWWQQLKKIQERSGKPKIQDWEKMKKALKEQFLPFNYTQTLYQRLQNFR